MRTLPIAAVLLLVACLPARPGTSTGEPRFRELYQELVETNTSLSAGSCTLAAERMAAHYFTGMAKVQRAKGDTNIADAMEALVRNPNDERAIALVSSKDPGWNSTLRTTCVATTLEAGHATNALPQRARANVNCRIFPGVPIETVHTKLEQLAADPAVMVTTLEANGPISTPPPLTPQILAPVQKLSAQFWPGLPVLPLLLQGASDGKYLNAAGIPSYGISGLFAGPDVGNVHGLNEYVSVQTVMECRDFLYRLVKIYAEQK